MLNVDELRRGRRKALRNALARRQDENRSGMLADGPSDLATCSMGAELAAGSGASIRTLQPALLLFCVFTCSTSFTSECIDNCQRNNPLLASWLHPAPRNILYHHLPNHQRLRGNSHKATSN